MNFALVTLFLQFTTGCEFHTFTTLFLLQMASMCDLTICWGHVGTEAAKLENPESPVFVPSPPGTCLQPRAYR